MFDGILSPAFLQAAGNTKLFTGVKLFTLAKDPTFSSVSCNGEITVTSIKNGTKHVDTYTDLNEDALNISADANTWITIEGALIGDWEMGADYFSKMVATNTALTSLSCSDCSALQELNLSTNTALTSLSCNGCYTLQELNLSTNTALTSLDCSDCSALQELNLSTNTALTTLNCTSCKKVESISTLCNNSTVATAIAGIISNADENAGVVKTNSDGDYYSTIETAATAKGWTVEPLVA